jgi:hypothetical protein
MTRRLCVQTTVLLLLSAVTAADAQRGTITGKVSYQGPGLTTQLVLPQDARQYCGSATSTQRLIERGGVSRVVVFLEGMPSVDMNGKPIEVRNVNCDFEPAIQVAESGADLVLVNQDPMLHVVRMYRSGLLVGEFPLSAEGGTRTNRRLLEGPGLIDVQCRSHEWMRSNIWVFDHPYYALTDADGTFQIPFVPPGKYKISAWHSELGVQTRDITVSANQVVPIEFVYQRLVAQ